MEINFQEAENSFQLYKGYKNRKESLSCVERFDKLQNAANAIKEDPKFSWLEICKFH